MPKKIFFAFIGLFLLISLSLTSLTAVAQATPHIPVLPQSQGLLTEHGFGEPDITVDNTADTVDANPGDGVCADAGGQCTLRAAIMESNAFPLTQTIYVPAGTYLLTIPGTEEDAAATGDLDITDMVLIIGAGQGETIIDGNDLDRVFHIHSYISQIEVYDMPQLNSMTIQGGNAPYGGGIFADVGVEVMLRLVTLRDNYAYGQYPCGQAAGAAIYADGWLLLLESTVTENRTPNTDISTHYGAIGGFVELQQSSVVNNETDWAIVGDHNTCSDSTGTGYLGESLVANNTGGAIYLEVFNSIFDSTITQNAVGILIDIFDPSLDILSSIYTVTLADNGLYGLKVESPINLILEDTIISGHDQDCDDSAALAIDPDYQILEGFNLFSDAGCDTQYFNFVNTDPQLLPLADNGGSILTRAVAPTSPAIYGDPCWETVDVRGGFPQSEVCTIGAYKYNDQGGDFPPKVRFLESDQEENFPPFSRLSHYLYLDFDDVMYDPSGNTDPDDITNPNNYLMTLTGTDAGFETAACGGTVQTHEIVVPITNVVYGEPWPMNNPNLSFRSLFGGEAFIEFDAQAVGGSEYYLPTGAYTFTICDNVRNKKGVALDGDLDYLSGGHFVQSLTNYGVSQPQAILLDAYIGNTLSSYKILPSASSIDLSSGIDMLDLSFSILMDGYPLIDPANMRLVRGGSNGVVETSTCDALSGDDSLVAISDVLLGNHYGDTSVPYFNFVETGPYYNARLELAQPLSANAYRLLLCDDILSWEHIPLDGDYDDVPGGDFLLDFVVDGFVPTLPTPVAPTLNDYSDVLVALNLPNVSDVPAGTVLQIGRLTGESSSIVGSVDVGTATFVDSKLTCETAYRYRVRLYDATEPQFSEWSDYLDVTTANCVTSLQHTFGLYKEGQWLFYAVDGYQRDDVRFQFGPTETGWTALVGDWNGDGMPGIGLYKNGTFMLRDLSGTDVIDLSFDFGPPSGAVPIVGDWDGDGTDTIGVFVGGTFYLRNSNATGSADLTFSLGSLSSQPLAGDWNGDGTDSVGYFENNIFNLATAGAAPTVYTSFSFGPMGWSPVFGDWNGDLTDTIGLYNNGLWRLRNSNTIGPVDYGFSYGDLEGGWQPLAFDGDTSVLNRLFNATVPTPRVPVIPGPDLNLPTPTPLTPSPPLAGVIKTQTFLYKGPGTCFDLADHAQAGDLFEILGTAATSCGPGLFYYYVSDGNNEGWVVSNHIYPPNDSSAIPTMPSVPPPTPAPTHTSWPTVAPGTANVGVDRLLKGGPGSCYPPVSDGTSVSRGEVVTLLNRSANICDSIATPWYYAYFYVEKTNGARGWIALDALAISDAEAVPIGYVPSPTPSPTVLYSTLTPSMTPTDIVPPSSGYAIMRFGGTLYRGPGDACYPKVPNSYLEPGATVLLLGRAPAICGAAYSEYYYYVLGPNMERGWFEGHFLDLPDSVDNVPLISAPSTPVPTQQPTPGPYLAILKYATTVYSGPGFCYAFNLGQTVDAQEVVMLHGRVASPCNGDTVFYIEQADGRFGWLSEQALILPDNVASVPVLTVPSLTATPITPTLIYTQTVYPTLTPSITPTPTLPPTATPID